MAKTQIPGVDLPSEDLDTVVGGWQDDACTSDNIYGDAPYPGDGSVMTGPSDGFQPFDWYQEHGVEGPNYPGADLPESFPEGPQIEY